MTSAVNPDGASSTLQMKVNLEITRVLTMLNLPYIDMSLEDHMFKSFEVDLAYQRDFFWLQVLRCMKNVPLGRK